MNFSEEWKSLFPISSTFNPPLLITSPQSHPLGPLLFSPIPKSLNLILSHPLFSSPFSLPPFHHRRHHNNHNPIPSINNNNLQILKLSNFESLLFFPFGNHLGFIKLGFHGNHISPIEIDGYEIHESEDEFDSRIVKISVSDLQNFESGNSVDSVNSVVGLVLACTVDSIHWYRIEIDNNTKKKPNLVYLGSKEFKESVIVHACWNPHLLEECLVLLKNGEMFLFELSGLEETSRFPEILEGSKIVVSWEDDDEGLECVDSKVKDSKWLSCGFSWHPRIFVVACSSVVFMVDWRLEESDVSVLASVGTIHYLNCTTVGSEFVVFCNVGCEGFYFTVATEEYLFLFDVRKPMMPVLQWFHGLHKPRFMEVFRLSKLRSSSVNDDKFKWASDSGFAILLGSPSDSKYKVFCYGPPLPAPENSVALKVTKFGNSSYAWELPSEISLLGRRCNSGDCLLKQDFENAALPEWRTERLLGFCIFDFDVSDSLPEPDGSRGFTLIRLLSSGRLESQKYLSSFDFVKLEETSNDSVKAEDFFLDLFIDQKYKFPKRFRYLHLDSLLGFMTANLPKVLMSKMIKNCGVSNEENPYTQDSYERICDILKAAGVDSLGFPPAIENVLNNISWPMNLHEITSSRMWGGINVESLHLAFCIYSELVGVLVEHRKISMEALEIPMLPQLPPFFSKIPTSRSHRWSWELQLGDVLVGPILPLPYLRALQKVKKDKSSLRVEEEGNDEAEMSCECNKVMIAASEMAISGSPSELNDSLAVSLGNDVEDRWVDSEVLKPIFLHRPSVSLEKNRGIVATSLKNHVYEDEKFDTFISKTRVKEKSSSPPKEPAGFDIFDDLCPIELNFDCSEVNFGVKELKGYNLLKRQFSTWQSGKKQYQDFYKSLKIQKRAS